MAKTKTKKTSDEVISEGEISWVEKTFDEKGKLLCYNVFLPNLTLVSLSPEEFYEFCVVMSQAARKEFPDEEEDEEPKHIS